MNLDICVTNRDSIYHWLGEAIKELETYRELVGATSDPDGAERLGQAFAKAWESRETWLTRYESGQDDDDQQARSNLPSAGSMMGDLLLGTHLRERYEKVLSGQERRVQERRPRRLRGP